MRVLVCGGRDFVDFDFLNFTLSKLQTERGPFSLIIHGGARGADALADVYAAKHFLPLLRFPADWGRHGRSAGPIRNAQMLKDGRPDLVVAFKGGNGTADMVKQATKAGVEVFNAV